MPANVFHLARADNGVIGAGGQLPWHLPADFRRFKANTLGRPMVMGRRTFDSLPGLLPGRRHIVLTRDRHWRRDGAEVAHDPQAALAVAGAGAGPGPDGVAEVAVIGGAEVFALLLAYATRIELTEVHCTPPGDAAVPPFAGWREAARADHPAADGRPGYSFVTLLPPRTPLAIGAPAG